MTLVEVNVIINLPIPPPPSSSLWPILPQTVARVGQNNLLVLEALVALFSSPRDSSGLFPCRTLVLPFLLFSQFCAGFGDFPL